jgi:hypothetical protein
MRPLVRSSSLLLFAISITLMVGGCQPVLTPPTPPPVSGELTSYYGPRNTPLRFLYHHQDNRGINYSDSNYYAYYTGLSTPSGSKAIDGFGPIEAYWSCDTAFKHKTALRAYVSDSLIIEYGATSGTTDQRIIIMQDSLVVGNEWTAATSYKIPDGRQVAITAHVDKHWAQLGVADTSFPDVFQISFKVTSSGIPEGDTLSEFRNGAHTEIFFAKPSSGRTNSRA